MSRGARTPYPPPESAPVTVGYPDFRLSGPLRVLIIKTGILVTVYQDDSHGLNCVSKRSCGLNVMDITDGCWQVMRKGAPRTVREVSVGHCMVTWPMGIHEACDVTSWNQPRAC